MDEAFTWQLMLRAAPNQVFCSLVRAASDEGRVCGVEDYGSVLTYTPTRQSVDLVGQMRAAVRACPEGSLVTIAPADPRHASAGALAVQARSVAHLIHRLRRHYAAQTAQTAQGA